MNTTHDPRPAAEIKAIEETDVEGHIQFRNEHDDQLADDTEGHRRVLHDVASTSGSSRRVLHGIDPQAGTDEDTEGHYRRAN